MQERLNIVPRFTETPCGQFNPESDDYRKCFSSPDQSLNPSVSFSSPLSLVRLISVDPNTDNLINGLTTETLIDCTESNNSIQQPRRNSQEENSQLSRSMETQNIIDLDFNNLGHMDADDLSWPCRERPTIPKINIQMAKQNLMVCLNDEQIMNLITPETEKSCFEFLQSTIPATASIIHEKDLKNLILDSDLVDKLVLSASVLQAESAENPFQFSTNEKLSDNEMKVLEKLENELTADLARGQVIALDHGYSATQRHKRNHSDSDDESTLDSEYPSSIASSSISQLASATKQKGEPKKKRQRGIYRLEDVTNEEERRNYIERRMKNNVSSKASRANKKSYFSKLESNAAILENENVRLSKQITTLDSHIKEIKNFLINKFNTK